MKYRLMIFNFISVVISIVMIFFLFEVSIRIFEILPRDKKLQNQRIMQPSSIEGLEYEFKKNSSIQLNNLIYRTNSFGFREKEFNQAPEEDTYRIIMLGDSALVGVGVEPHQRYSDILEDKLNSQSSLRKFEVLNLGVIGYNTRQELKVLEHKALNFKPNMIILCFIANDIDPHSDWIYDNQSRNMMPKEGWQKYPQMIAERENAAVKIDAFTDKNVFAARFKIPGKRFLKKLKTYQFLARLYYDKLMKESQVFSRGRTILILEAYSDKAQDGWTRRSQYISEIISVCQQNNIKPFVLIHPLNGLIAGEFPDYPNPSLLVSEVCRRHNCLYIDLIPYFRKAFKEGKRLYLDPDDHLSKEGNALVAQLLYEKLKEEVF